MSDQLPGVSDDDMNAYRGIVSREAEISRNAHVYAAARTNPDQFARARQLSATTGIPAPVVERNLPEVEAKAKVDEYRSLLADSPKLAARVAADVNFAKVAHDDFGTFAKSEKVFTAYRGPAPTVGSYLTGLGESIAGGWDKFKAGLDLATHDLLYGDDQSVEGRVTRQDLLRKYEQAQAHVDLTTPDFKTTTAAGIYGGLSSTAQQAPGLAASIATGSLAPSLLQAGLQVGFDAYGKYRARGGTPGEAALGGTLEGGFEVAFERLPLGYVVDKFGKTGLREFVGGVLARELPTEFATTIAQSVTDTLIANPDKTLADLKDTLPADLYQTALGVLVQSTLLGGAGAGASAFAKRQQAAAQAERTQQIVEILTDVAQNSKTLQRDPAAFESALAEQAAGTPLTDVYIEAAKLGEFFQSQGIDPVEALKDMPEVRDQFFQSAATDGDVAIPVEKFASRLASDPKAASLLEHVRFAPDQMSPAEAKAFQQGAEEELQAEAERVLGEQQDQYSWAASQEKVKTTVRDELVATQRFRPEVNESYATSVAAFYAVQAARLGITPEEMYQKFPLRVRAEGVGELDQGLRSSARLAIPDAPSKDVLDRFARVEDVPLAQARRTQPQRVDGKPSAGPIAEGYADRPVAVRLENGEFLVFDGHSRTSAALKRGDAALPMYVVDAKQYAPELAGQKSREVAPGEDEALLRALGVGGFFQDARGVDTHLLGVQRGERVTGKQVRFTDAEKAAIVEAAAKLKSTEKAVTEAVRATKLDHPAKDGWAPLTFVGLDPKGKYVYQSIPYSFNVNAKGRALQPGTPEYGSRVGALARRMTDEVLAVYQRAVAGDAAAKKIIAQAGWYREMRARLRQEFGGLGDVFADLLGATSPNTPVRDNWTNAVDVLRRATRGDFDALMPKWLDWQSRVEQTETAFRAWFNERMAEGLTKKAIKALPEYKAQREALSAIRDEVENLLPTKESGAKYGFNGRNVIKALTDLWRVVQVADADIGRGGQAPKAQNFAGNLIGFRERATIDVWAARMLQRLAGQQRVPSVAETGVSGELLADGRTTLQFGFGQDVFTRAAAEIRRDPLMAQDKNLREVNDDDLQAIVWFIEKEIWARNNWTNAAGEGGSFEFEASLTGSAAQERIRELRKIIDSTKSSDDQKRAATAELKGLERPVDRFQGGLSIPQSEATQGVDFVPTDADMATLGNRIRTAIYETDDGATVLGSKTLSTEGRYGGVERSLDIEVVAREGYDPTTLWAEMLRAARDAKQDAVFLSRVLRPGEDVDAALHRPGVEIYFRDAKAGQELEELLGKLAGTGVEFYTIAVDGRPLPAYTDGAMPAAVGVRFQYVPEFDARYGDPAAWQAMSDDQIAERIRAQEAEFDQLARRVMAEVPGVTFAQQLWYDTEVRFSHEYDESINGLADETAGREDRPTVGGAWHGRPVREGVAAAARQSEVAAAGAAPESGVPARGDSAGASAAGADGQVLNQDARGTYSPSARTITLLKDADLSTFLHETGHFYLDVLSELAAQPNAPAEIVADMNTLLAWFKVKDLDTWRAMSVDQQRVSHEKFARGYEAYLFRGESPNAELRSLFARFRAWLLQVYQSVKALNVTLTPEVTQVFDRMLATEQQIRDAEETAGFRAVFSSREESGMSEAQWAAYQAQGAAATADAQADLERRSLRDMQWLANAKARELKKLQKAAESARKKIEETVTREVEAMPLYAAMRWLRTGKTIGPDGEEIQAEKGFRLSTDALAEMYPETMLARPDLDGLRGMTAQNGLHPDAVAGIFGFTSGDQLIREILAAEPMADVIEGMTDQRMLEEHGELTDARAMERAAERAIHNEARTRFVATELNALQKALTSRDRKVDLKAAKVFAEETIARQTVRDAVKANRYQASETRAAKAAGEAVRKGKLEDAAKAKRSQLLANLLYRASSKAGTEVEKSLDYLKKFTKDSKTLDPEYAEQIDALLERFDLRVSVTQKALAKRASLTDWVESQRAMGLEPEIPAELLAEANRVHYTQLTLEQFRGLVDTVKQIEHLGRLKKKLLTAKDQREFAAVVETIVTSINDNARGKPNANNRTETGPMAAAERMFKGFLASHRKISSLARELDGFKDGGAMWEYVIRTMNEAGDRETTMREQATVKLAALIQPLMQSGKMGGKGMFIPEIGKSLNREERIAVALNAGNAANLQRLTSGEGWTQDQLRAVLVTITPAEADFVQGVWDFFESYRPEIGAKERRVSGREPEWVEPTPLTLGGKVLRGGYYPIEYDPRASARAEQFADAEDARQMMRAAYTSATTRRSFTKSRAEEVTGRPLMLSFAGIYQGANEVIHDLAWHEWLIDANRLLRNPDIDRAIRSVYGAETVQQFKTAFEDVARGEVPAQQDLERVLNHLRTGTTVAGLGWNLFTSLLQPIGLTQSMVRIGPRYVAKGIGKVFPNPLAAAREVYGKSEMMRVRAKTMQREINEIQNQVSGGKSKARNAVEATFFVLIQKTQLVVDLPTWLGGYERAIAEGNDEARAIALADQAVIDAQGGGQMKDLARVQRGGAGLKLFTNFYSFFNVAYNLGVERTKATNFKSPAQVGALMVDYLLLYTLPAVLGTLLKAAVSPDEEDEEALAKKLVADQISFLLGLMVGVRELTVGTQALAGVEQFGGAYAGPAGVRFFNEFAKFGKQAGQGELDEALFRSGANLFGIVLHLPTGQAVKTVEGTVAILEGDTQDPRALLTGPPR